MRDFVINHHVVQVVVGLVFVLIHVQFVGSDGQVTKEWFNLNFIETLKFQRYLYCMSSDGNNMQLGHVL